MMALCAYPASTKPVIKSFLGYSEKKYRKFLLDRKIMITEMVLYKNQTRH
jgi:hypothetical protein